MLAARSISNPKQCAAGFSFKSVSSRSTRVTARHGVMNIVAMARVESEILEAGFKAPDFTLPEPLTGKSVNLYDYTKDAKATLIMIICNHCPFVVHLKPSIVDLAKEYQAKGVKFVAISPNNADVTPKDAPEKMAEDAVAQGYTFPYLYDGDQEVAKAYQAACTPEFMVFDKDLKLVYHGQFDDSRPPSKGGTTPITAKDIRTALDAGLSGEAVPGKWRPSIGCNVKWIPGKEPAWYG
ncbi:hypothetical protein Ndes2526B_g01468 [Nannochloris sp. 'desiccata']